MMLVVDASVVVQAALTRVGFDLLSDHRLVAPRLLWSEAPSALHEMTWHGTITAELAALALQRVLAAPIERKEPRRLAGLAWQVADELGWAKTYDAEYVATARSMKCPLLTVDKRLKRGAARLVETLEPTAL